MEACVMQNLGSGTSCEIFGLLAAYCEIKPTQIADLLWLEVCLFCWKGGLFRLP
jgi:hypothetical protein